jgi:hypothetical protein
MCAGKHHRHNGAWISLAGLGETFGRMCDLDFTFKLCDLQVNKARHLSYEAQRRLLLDLIRYLKRFSLFLCHHVALNGPQQAHG